MRIAPEIRGGKKWYVIYDWVHSGLARRMREIEFFETEIEAQDFVKEHSND